MARGSLRVHVLTFDNFEYNSHDIITTTPRVHCVVWCKAIVWWCKAIVWCGVKPLCGVV